MPLGEGLDRLVRHLRWAPSTGTVRVLGEWERVVGPAIAAHARPVSVERGELVLVASDPVWASQLRWMEAELLERLRTEAGASFERIVVRVRPR
jgi:predicted nucleic acid-binding Zn ribbon protein